MSAYQQLRTKQRERITRIDTHRVMELEADDAAPEGAWTPIAPIKTVEEEAPWLWLLYGVAILATVAACSLIASYS
jgi:hypothetical protein